MEENPKSLNENNSPVPLETAVQSPQDAAQEIGNRPSEIIQGPPAMEEVQAEALALAEQAAETEQVTGELRQAVKEDIKSREPLPEALEWTPTFRHIVAITAGRFSCWILGLGYQLLLGRPMYRDSESYEMAALAIENAAFGTKLGNWMVKNKWFSSVLIICNIVQRSEDHHRKTKDQRLKTQDQEQPGQENISAKAA